MADTAVTRANSRRRSLRCRAVPGGRHDAVTVVVTNFNYGRFLEEAVASALGQDGGPPRVLVVDDGSTDPHTLAVLDALPDGVRVHRQANTGVAAARNTGLALADTPYLILSTPTIACDRARWLRCGRRCEPTRSWASPTASRASSACGRAR